MQREALPVLLIDLVFIFKRHGELLKDLSRGVSRSDLFLKVVSGTFERLISERQTTGRQQAWGRRPVRK